MKYIIGILCILLLIAGIFIINDSLTIDNLKTELAICQGNSTSIDSLRIVFFNTVNRRTLNSGYTVDTMYFDWNSTGGAYKVFQDSSIKWKAYYQIRGYPLNPDPKSKNMIYDYATKRVAYEVELTDMDATVYIPQYKIVLDTYRWYREVKGYSVRKSIQLTEKHWTLNLVN